MSLLPKRVRASLIGRAIAVGGTVLLGLSAAAWAGTATSPWFVAVPGPPADEPGTSRGAAWGDYDGDGDPDLFVTRPSWDGRPVQRNALYRNDGEGRFSRVDLAHSPAGAWEGAAWVDVDGDGDLDLHVLGRDGSGSLLYRSDRGRLELHTPDPFPAAHAASMACWADADGDGRLDVFIVGSGEGRNTLYRNLGDWRFEPAPPAQALQGDGSARACIWADLDADGLPELAVANARQPAQLFRNRGDLRLVEDTAAPLRASRDYGYGLSAADVDGDGHVDLFLANFDAPNVLFLNRGDGTLRHVPEAAGLQSAASKGHAWGDYDLDGHEDLYLGSGTPRPGMLNRLYRGLGGGRFVLVEDSLLDAHADTSAAVAAADYDRDGDLDVFVANWGSPGNRNRLYAGTAADDGGRHWLAVALRGTRSNRMGIGARVSVRTTLPGQEARWMHRWLFATTGYAGQNEPRLHFGLGAATTVDSLVIVWPSGTVDRAARLPVDTLLEFEEGLTR